MISSLISLVATSLKIRTGVAKWIVFGAIALAVISLCVAAKQCYDASVIKEHDQKVETEILRDKVIADERASEQRAEDTIKNAEADRQRKDAINEATDEPLPESSLRLGCERLRQQGYDTSNYAECGGR